MVSGSSSLEFFSISVTNTLSNSNYVTVVTKPTGSANPIDPQTVGIVGTIVICGVIIGAGMIRRSRNTKQ
jgi:hypothetical protein